MEKKLKSVCDFFFNHWDVGFSARTKLPPGKQLIRFSPLVSPSVVLAYTALFIFCLSVLINLSLPWYVLSSHTCDQTYKKTFPAFYLAAQTLYWRNEQNETEKQITRKKNAHWMYFFSVLFWFGCYEISTLVGYLMPNPVYTHILNIYDLWTHLLNIFDLWTHFVDNILKQSWALFWNG